MATPSEPQNMSFGFDPSIPAISPESDLLAEILSAEADFERGDYIDLTREQLAHAIATGEFPWPDEPLA